MVGDALTEWSLVALNPQLLLLNFRAENEFE